MRRNSRKRNLRILVICYAILKVGIHMGRIITNCTLEFLLYAQTEMLNVFVIGFRNLRVSNSTRHV